MRRGDVTGCMSQPDDSELEDLREQKLSDLKQRDAGAEGGAGGDAAADDPVAVTGREDLDDLVADNEVVLVDFHAEWCGPCKMMEPVVESLAAETEALVAKVDIDDHQDIAREQGVQGVPTFVLYAGGEPVEELVGAQERATFDRLIESAT